MESRIPACAGMTASREVMADILIEYDRRLDAGLIRPDAAQRPVVVKLDELAIELAQSAPASGLLARFRKAPPPPKGLYIHGAVGRGKTMMMDLFFEASPVARKRAAISAVAWWRRRRFLPRAWR